MVVAKLSVVAVDRFHRRCCDRKSDGRWRIDNGGTFYRRIDDGHSSVSEIDPR